MRIFPATQPAVKLISTAAENSPTRVSSARDTLVEKPTGDGGAPRLAPAAAAAADDDVIFGTPALW